MGIDLRAARDFMAGHARLLDRRRFARVLGECEPGALLAAVSGYRNDDGGYGWGIEADLRAPESQPGGALHAFEAFAEAAPETTPEAVALCDWLGSVTLPDGGLPFALPVSSPAGVAPWWASADPATSSVQITAAVTAAALDLAGHDPAVAAHPWLATATGYCLDAIAANLAPSAYELMFALRFLDAASDTSPRAAGLLKRAAPLLPPDGVLPVEGGTASEVLRPLDFAPFPGRPVRELFSDQVINAELDRLEAGQHADGGWTVDYAVISPAGALDWRGHATVRAVQILRRNGLAA
jgi:hypothetical protein